MQDQYTPGEQAKRKNKFVNINSTFHQLHRPSVFIRVLQNKSTSIEFTSSKNQPTAQCRQNEFFCKELAQTDKQSHDSGCGKRLRNSFPFAAKGTKVITFGSINVKLSGSGGPAHVEGGCHSCFGSQIRPVSELVFSCEKDRCRKQSSIQPEGPEQQYSVSALQDERAFSVQENVVTRGPKFTR